MAEKIQRHHQTVRSLASSIRSCTVSIAFIFLWSPKPQNFSISLAIKKENEDRDELKGIWFLCNREKNKENCVFLIYFLHGGRGRGRGRGRVYFVYVEKDAGAFYTLIFTVATSENNREKNKDKTLCTFSFTSKH